MPATDDPPPPGSDAAIAKGCICAVLSNGHGKGSGQFADDGRPLYWARSDCPLHGTGLMYVPPVRTGYSGWLDAGRENEA